MLALAGLVLLVIAVIAYPTVVSGMVIRLDGRPAAGAWVRVQTTSNLTYAASDGRTITPEKRGVFLPLILKGG